MTDLTDILRSITRAGVAAALVAASAFAAPAFATVALASADAALVDLDAPDVDVESADARAAVAAADSTASVAALASPALAARIRPTAETGDTQFQSLFTAWQQMDGPATQAISIPSRRPVDAMALTSSFGVRSDPFSGRRARHNGIDIPGPIGTPIYATADGTVGRAQRLGGYGNYVEIEHGTQIQTRYGHLSAIGVISGQRVRRGDLIGYMGSTGRSTGSHLHYEVRIAGAPVNPIPFVQEDGMMAMAQGRDAAAIGGPRE